VPNKHRVDPVLEFGRCDRAIDHRYRLVRYAILLGVEGI
jgi:hypothetical protein